MFHSEACLSPNRSALLLSSFWLVLPLSDSFFISFIFSHHSASPMVPNLRFGGRRWVFFSSLLFSLSPCLSLFGIYLGIPDSSGFIPTSPSSSLVGCPTLWCVWGTGWRGRRGPRLEASEFKGEAARNVGEGGRKW